MTTHREAMDAAERVLDASDSPEGPCRSDAALVAVEFLRLIASGQPGPARASYDEYVTTLVRVRFAHDEPDGEVPDVVLPEGAGWKLAGFTGVQDSHGYGSAFLVWTWVRTTRAP
jgi:hypothetical protein